MSFIQYLTSTSILRVFISFTKQFFIFHSNKVKCEEQILPSVGFEPTTSCIRGKHTAWPRGPHGREQTTPRLIFTSIIYCFQYQLATRIELQSVGETLRKGHPDCGLWSAAKYETALSYFALLCYNTKPHKGISVWSNFCLTFVRVLYSHQPVVREARGQGSS